MQETEDTFSSKADQGNDLPPHPLDPRRSASHRFILQRLLTSAPADHHPSFRVQASPPPRAPSQPPLAPPSAPLAALRFDQPGPLAASSQRWTRSWARILPPRLWTMGFAVHALASLLDPLPPAFCAALEAAAPRLQRRRSLGPRRLERLTINSLG